MKKDSVARIAGALPRKFDFYHLGVVRMQDGIQDDLWSEGARAIGFSLEGDVRSALLIRVEFAEDLSVYAEMGNIIASQLATRLAEEVGIDVIVSPPRVLSAAGALRLIAHATSSGRRFERRTYLHLHQKTVPVDAWILDLEGAQGKGDSLEARELLTDDQSGHSGEDDREIGNA